MNEAESLRLFEQFGIASVRHVVAASPEDAAGFARQLGLAVVVKILSRDVAHKSDINGVRLGVAPDEVAACCRQLRQAFDERRPSQSFEGWLVQEHIVDGTELLLGLVRDPQLGLALVLGAGGLATEVFDDTALRLLPLRPGDPEEMLGSLKSRVLLHGFRGRPVADLEALYAAVNSMANLAEALGGRLQGAEINPLFVLPKGQGVRAADGLVVLS